jgi:formylmethanofuran dehydrogenase subunit B
VRRCVASFPLAARVETRVTDRKVPHVTCLGCGCACDDIILTLRNDQIVHAERACQLGVAWFDDGRVPARVQVGGRDCGLDEALDAGAALLHAARGRALVFLGDDITSEAQRATVEIADHLHAVVDGVVSEPAAAGILAGQRRGRATCTLGEIRNRGDLLLFWGTDPDQRYPRYRSRYALHPVALHLAGGQRGRTVVSVTIGADRGPAEADLHIALRPEDEVVALSALRAALQGRELGELATLPPELKQLTSLLQKANYVVIVHDGDGGEERRSPERAEGLITLAQRLNGPTRAALSTLRGGGNRSGAEVVLTWQTGFPFAVDFRRGAPRYRPDRRGTELLEAGVIAAALVVGVPAGIPASARDRLGRMPTIVVGPRASEAPFTAKVAIDTGVAGIHEAGIGYRMDDLPLPLQAALPSPRSATDALKRLADRLAGAEVRR